MLVVVLFARYLTLVKEDVMNSKSKQSKKQQLINLYGLECCWCGKHFKDNELITIEHLLPQNDGGSDALDNLCLACFPAFGAQL